MGTHRHPHKKRTEPPIFGPCLLWPNGCMYQDTNWYRGRPQPRRHCVRWEPSSPSLKGEQLPNFQPMFVVARRLDGLRCHLVWRQASAQATLMGTQFPQIKKGHRPHPIFGPCVVWPNGWMDQDTTWYESRPRPKPHCVRRGPTSSPAKGAQQPPLFGPMSIVATVAHISYC